MLNKMKSLIAQLKEADAAYYGKDNPIMTNLEYDRLYNELAQLERDTGIILASSPTQRVSGEVLEGLSAVSHTKPMLSADKTKFTGEIFKFVSGRRVVISWKLDGLTLVLRYAGGKLVQAITRGDGLKGEDVTHTVRVMENVPLTIPCTEPLEVRGEGVVSWQNFKELKASDWADGAYPLYYEFQLRYYLAVMDVDFGAFSALWGNNPDYDLATPSLIRDRAKEDMIFERLDQWIWSLRHDKPPNMTEVEPKLALESLARICGPSQASLPTIEFPRKYEKSTVSPREWAQTAAVGIALRNAGFGLQFGAAGDSFDAPAVDELGGIMWSGNPVDASIGSAPPPPPAAPAAQAAPKPQPQEPELSPFEQALKVSCPIAKYSGKTLGEVMQIDPKALYWVATKFTGNAEIVAAAKLICDEAVKTTA